MRYDEDGYYDGDRHLERIDGELATPISFGLSGHPKKSYLLGVASHLLSLRCMLQMMRRWIDVALMEVKTFFVRLLPLVLLVSH